MFVILGSVVFKVVVVLGFYVNGGKLYDFMGKLFYMRGINYGYFWFKNDLNMVIFVIVKMGVNMV